MKVNKLIPLSLVALMGAGLTACGGGDSDALIVWATANEQAVVEAVLEDYNKTASEEDQIKVKYVAVAEGDTGTEVAKDPSAKTAPELFLVADDHIYNLQSKNIIVDLTSAYGTSIKANNTEVSVTGASYNNKVFGFPVTNDNGYFLWYNTDYVSADQAKTFEGLLGAAKTAGKKVLLDIANGWYAPTFFFSPDVCGVDSLKFKENKDGDVVYEIGWDSDNAVAAFNAVNKLISTKASAKGTHADNFTTGGNDAIVAGFKDGSVVAAVSGTWMLEDLKTAVGESKLAATKLPTLKVGTKDCQMGTFTGSKVYCVNAAKTGDDAAAKRTKAAKLADVLTQKAAQLKRFEVRATVPCNKEALKDDAYTKNVNIAGKALQAQCEAAAAIQSTSAEGRYWDVGKAIGQAMLDGNLGTYADTKAFLKGECDILRKAA